MIKELTPLEALEKLTNYKCSCMSEKIECKEIIETALKRKEKLELAIRDLFVNHIDFVIENDKCYFKIKNSKGKEKSFTSKTFESFWKEVLL